MKDYYVCITLHVGDQWKEHINCKFTHTIY